MLEEKSGLEIAVENLKLKLRVAEETISKKEETTTEDSTTPPWEEELKEVNLRVRSLFPQDFLDSIRETQENNEKLSAGILSNIFYGASESDSIEKGPFVFRKY